MILDALQKLWKEMIKMAHRSENCKPYRYINKNI